MSRFRAVIFDMDGVIVDSEPRHERAFFEVIEEIGYGNRHGVVFSEYVGRTDTDLWKDFVARNKPEQPLEELLVRKRLKVLDILLRDEPLFPGLYELVRTLAQTHVLGLASGSERCIVDAVLGLRDLRQFFKATMSGSDITHGKPAPDIFLKTAAQLGVAPGDCVVIEDSKPGIAAGLAAGMTVIAITNTHSGQELANAHHVVSSYDEIGRLLAG